jgi:hypothetical protein
VARRRSRLAFTARGVAITGAGGGSTGRRILLLSLLVLTDDMVGGGVRFWGFDLFCEAISYNTTTYPQNSKTRILAAYGLLVPSARREWLPARSTSTSENFLLVTW